MTKLIKQMTLEEHIEAGKALVAAYNALNLVKCRNSVSSPACRMAVSLSKKLDSMRSLLDDEVCGLTNDCDPRNIAIGIYYGADLIGERCPTKDDAFAGMDRAP